MDALPTFDGRRGYQAHTSINGVSGRACRERRLTFCVSNMGDASVGTMTSAYGELIETLRQ